jgi:uncharacterized lipoprotein YddW (UPF0748 family)
MIATACSGRGDIVTQPPEPPGPPPADTALPTLQREFRGLWVATVANIDWPSRTGLTAEQQRSELRDILDRAVAARMNAVVLQVRPAADALYLSSLEPWSRWLTGTQGLDPGYDPLEFALAEAHARGLELHAWVNPFRAGHAPDAERMATSHVTHTRPDLVHRYDTFLWLDPGEPDAQDHSMRVILDIVRRYDIDGVHMDDYFYPYPANDAAGRQVPFPDTASYRRFGGSVPLGDWRRANIDRFVERMYAEVHAVRPTVRVGISPFGIWRPGNPPGVQGFDAFAGIYADARKWLEQGWMDYMVPQLYWSIAAPQQSFPALLDWWLARNLRQRHVWPGLAAYKVNNGTSGAYTLQEIPDQVRVTRSRAGGTGHILFNTTSTLKQGGGALATALVADVYRQPAVPPAYPWLGAELPGTPVITGAAPSLVLNGTGSVQPRWWVVRTRSSAGWQTRMIPGATRQITVEGSTDRVLVHAASQTMMLGPAAEWRR